MRDPDSAHFGYRRVAAGDKARLVAGVFDSVAGKYDLMNDLMSLGVHRMWKRFTLELSGVTAGQRVLDVDSGTGDLAAAFAVRVGKTSVFGLRNFTRISHALASLRRGGGPGGRGRGRGGAGPRAPGRPREGGD